ncbi:MAG: alkaline phosphatase D family protein [Halioglobus sp.]|nr:alkaline phosphatase D family protein [Halioglobus sp.]
MRRRTLVKGLAATSLLPLLGGNLVGCSDSANHSAATVEDIPVIFAHGIASGDPLTDRVILWTRVSPVNKARSEALIRVDWEIATDADFTDVVSNGSGSTSARVDYTLKVDATGLQAGQHYYYRFASNNAMSATGSTRTLPTGVIDTVRFAAVSCSNYPAGYFNVYREVAKADVDAVLHLGDYLYEYPAGGYASARAEEFGRGVEPSTELYSLEDYRTRYAQYRTDPDLQAAHAAHPFLVVWDDHEIANDGWRAGAENHTPATEGDYETRKIDAIQAWYEWQPVRPPADLSGIIYRRFQYGDLLDLLMLDTRFVARDRQFTYLDFLNGSTIDVPAARAGFGDPNRSILGDAQLDWLREQLTNSTARWQVLGQQVLLGRYWLPSPILEALDPNIASADSLAEGVAVVLAAFEAKNKPPADRTASEQALLDSAIPYNLDAWDGYEFERDALLRFARDLDSKLVVLAGDTHNAWSTQLTTAEGDITGVEFGCASVSSPGLEGVLGDDNAGLFAPIVSTLVDDLKYANLSHRGYLHLTLTPDDLVAEHRFINRIDSTNYAVEQALTKQSTVLRSDMVLT